MLRFDCLESRRLVAADISGIVFSDLSGNGFDGGDTLVGGATVELYQDADGDSSFDSGTDTLVGTTTTGTSGGQLGVYSFMGLGQATYFVRHTAGSGMIQRTGEDVVRVVIDSSNADGVLGQTIDSFNVTGQAVVDPPAMSLPNVSALDAPATEVLGGERDMFVSATSGTVGLDANMTAAGILEYSSSATGNGTRQVTWDGDDDDGATLDPTGLAGIDLTSSGTIDRMLFRIGADQANGEVTITAYSTATDISQAVQTINNTGGTPDQELSIAFSDFATTSGSGVDFTNVGAIELEITGINAVDGQINSITTNGPIPVNFAVFEPMTVGDLVFNDLDNSGTFDSSTENGIANVTVHLFEDTDGSGALSPGTDALVDTVTTSGGGAYGFANVIPGDYVVQIAQSNFNSGGALQGSATSTGNDPAPDPDDDVNDDDNGGALSGQGVVSDAITLVVGAEPTNDGDSDPDTNLAVDFGFFSEIDLEISKSDSVDPVAPGNQLTYTLDVENNGPAIATGVTVMDSLPTEATFVSANSGQGSVSHSSGLVTADLGTLVGGASTNVAITVTIDPSATSSFSNTATATANESDTDSSNNSATETTSVQISPSSIAGFVYVDCDGNGVRDPQDDGISNAVVTLTGTDVFGNSVSLSRTTDAEGAYAFSNVTPGTYTVTEQQPAFFPDGPESIGAPALGTIQNDMFDQIVLPSGVDAVEYNFGEGPPNVSKRMFLASFFS